MTFFIGVGSDQNYPWIKQDRSVQRLLNSARACAKRNRFNQFHKILKPLIRQENPEALFLAGRFSRPRETGDKHERRYIDYIQRAAAKEYPPALYILGFYYDMGDAVPVISHDQINAAQIFKRGAELKHAHCQHLDVTALHWGVPTESKSTFQRDWVTCKRPLMLSSKAQCSFWLSSTKRVSSGYRSIP
jgi:TPR repeat protein